MRPKLPRNITMRNINATHHTGLKAKNTILIGSDNAAAVEAASCCGEKFFVGSIFYLLAKKNTQKLIGQVAFCPVQAKPFQVKAAHVLLLQAFTGRTHLQRFVVLHRTEQI